MALFLRCLRLLKQLVDMFWCLVMLSVLSVHSLGSEYPELRGTVLKMLEAVEAVSRYVLVFGVV